MTGIMNNTARQYNLKGASKSGNRVTVRLKPGFNVVDDEHWESIVNLDFTKALKKDGKIDFGKKSLEDKELDADKSEIAQSKSTPVPQKSKEE